MAPRRGGSGTTHAIDLDHPSALGRAHAFKPCGEIFRGKRTRGATRYDVGAVRKGIIHAFENSLWNDKQAFLNNDTLPQIYQNACQIYAKVYTVRDTHDALTCFWHMLAGVVQRRADIVV